MNKNKRIGIVSGGFDPPHIGHLKMIQAARQNCDKLIVIVNSDRFLLTKKGYIFMPHDERKELLRGFKDVDQVISAIDGDQTVCQTLKLIADFYHDNNLVFFNGGDQTEPNVEEGKMCESLNIRMEFGMGGSKIQSSSSLTEKLLLKLNK